MLGAGQAHHGVTRLRACSVPSPAPHNRGDWETLPGMGLGKTVTDQLVNAASLVHKNIRLLPPIYPQHSPKPSLRNSRSPAANISSMLNPSQATCCISPCAASGNLLLPAVPSDRARLPALPKHHTDSSRPIPP